MTVDAGVQPDTGTASRLQPFRSSRRSGGMVQEAVAMIRGMPPNAGDIFLWGSLLTGCRKHKNINTLQRRRLS
ncbi:hypothetical protein MLD38_015307 [Melastoma candidum]|uniref:Uncharacterized protein n=1 Tax=Melastoma candidum TaxID=119954 RepID=A0ACB9RFT6_9MYRT|nr:hypothetical protein MLD38_015307 [Melastoma candidum]